MTDTEQKQILEQLKYLNEQSVTTSILLSSLLELLTKKGTITREEMQASIDEYQKMIIKEQQKIMKQAQQQSKNIKIPETSKILTPDDINNFRKSTRR